MLRTSEFQRPRSGLRFGIALAACLILPLAPATAQTPSGQTPNAASDKAPSNAAAPKNWMNSPELPKSMQEGKQEDKASNSNSSATTGSASGDKSGATSPTHGRPQAPEQPYPSEVTGQPDGIKENPEAAK